MRHVNKIIIHCAATKTGQPVTAADIRRWHMSKGWQGAPDGWSDIGYHYVIELDGTIQDGRPIERIGAHCLNHNRTSIGICMIGGVAEDGKSAEASFSRKQWAALESITCYLLEKFPDATVHGHREFSAKACPSFDARHWWYGGKGE